MIGPDETSLSIAVYDFAADGARLRELYRRAISVMTDAGVPPLELAWHVVGTKHGQYKSFARMHKKLEAEDFSKVASISIGHVEDGPEYDYTRRISEFSIAAETPHRAWEWSWTLYPRRILSAKEAAIDAMLRLAAFSGGQYGFVYHMSYRWKPSFYPGGLQSGDDLVKKEHPDFYDNRGWWGRIWWESGVPILLRDIFSINLLTRPYLNLRVGKATLEAWINSKASHGILERLEGNDQITLWRVHPQHISQVREDLFKAGAVFYWRFFEPGDPLERDFSKPFTPPNPIPDIYRAEFHAGHDPKVTR